MAVTRVSLGSKLSGLVVGSVKPDPRGTAKCPRSTDQVQTRYRRGTRSCTSSVPRLYLPCTSCVLRPRGIGYRQARVGAEPVDTPKRPPTYPQAPLKLPMSGRELVGEGTVCCPVTITFAIYAFSSYFRPGSCPLQPVAGLEEAWGLFPRNLWQLRCLVDWPADYVCRARPRWHRSH